MVNNPRRRRGEAGGGVVNDINANHAGANNSANNSRRRFPLQRPESRCWCLVRVGVVLTIISGLILAVFFYPFFKNDGYELEEAERAGLELLEELLGEEGNETPGKILRIIVEICNDLMLFELQLRAFLEGERVVTLIKEHLQPVQDRVTSLTIQTSQYEKMDHITGGPTHFITTSIQELDSIEENQLTRLDEQVSRIVIEETHLAVGLGETVLKLYDKATFVEQAVTHPLILEEGIIISLDGMDEKETARALQDLPNYPLYEVLPILSKLADKIDLKEQAYLQLQEIREELGFTEEFQFVGLMSLSDEEEEFMSQVPELSNIVEVLEYRMAEIEELIDEFEIPLQLVQSLHSELMSKISTLQQDLLNYATNRRRAYLLLRHTIQEDIRKLKVRIENLRYKYAKIAS